MVSLPIPGARPPTAAIAAPTAAIAAPTAAIAAPTAAIAPAQLAQAISQQIVSLNVPTQTRIGGITAPATMIPVILPLAIQPAPTPVQITAGLAAIARLPAAPTLTVQQRAFIAGGGAFVAPGVQIIA